MKRDLSSSCSYLHNFAREKPAHVQRVHGGTKDVQARIQHLEELVITLMNRDQPKDAVAQAPEHILQHTPSHPQFSNTIVESEATSEPRDDGPIRETIDRME